MKNIIAAALGAMMISSLAQAGSLSTTIGSEYLGLDFTQQLSPPLSLSAQLLNNFDHDDTLASVGLAYTLPLGAASVSVGGRANWYSLDQHGDEMTLAIGGDVQIPIAKSLAFYGSAYWGPLATGNLDASFDGRIGLNWRINQAIALDAGYRYSSVEYENGHQYDLANGAYAGVRVMF